MDAAAAKAKIRRFTPDLNSLKHGSKRSVQVLLRILAFSLADIGFMPQKSICIGIGERRISIAYGSRFMGRIMVNGWKWQFLKEIEGISPESVSSNAASANHEFKRKAEVVLCIPQTWVLTRTADFPLSVTENLPTVVSCELDRLTPFHADQVFYDYMILPETQTVPHSDSPDKIRVMISTCKIERIDPYLESFRKKGIKISRLTPELYCRNIALENSNKKKQLSHKEKKKLFPLPAGVVPIRLPEGEIEIPYPAIGGVLDSLTPGQERFNLLRKGKRDKVRIPHTLTTVLLLILLAVSILHLFVPLHFQEERLQKIENQINLRKETVKNTEALKRESELLRSEITTIRQFKKSRPAAVQILKEITAILPKNAWLSRIKTNDLSIEIEGYTTGSAAELITKLEGSDHFKKAEFVSPTFRDPKNNSERFVLKMEWKGKAVI
jgi:general secretion pathway protein L